MRGRQEEGRRCAAVLAGKSDVTPMYTRLLHVFMMRYTAYWLGWAWRHLAERLRRESRALALGLRARLLLPGGVEGPCRQHAEL